MFVITPENPNPPAPKTFKKDAHAKTADDGQGWVPTDVNDTLNAFDNGETRTPTLVVDQQPQTYQETTGALCASGYEKNGTQEAANDMYVVQEATAWDGSQVSSTLTANNANGAQRMPDKENFNAVIQPQVQCMEVFHCTTEDEVSHPIKARDYKDPQVVAIDMGAGKSQCGVTEEQSPTLTTTHGGEPAVCCGVDTYNLQDTGEVGRTLTAAGGGLNEHTPCVYEQNPNATYGVSGTSSKFGVGNNLSPAQTAAHPNMVSTTSVVRRLTPLECTRLQGYPDGWVDIGDWVDDNGKKHKDSDSPKYKALGNSIALPFWDWMAGRMCAKLRESGVANPTMASLFDGIGGFPLVYSWHGCEPIWASEIELYPIAVTKIRFADGMWKQYVRKEYRK
jgi:site-specific DNA-cytosine methylase